MLTQMTPIRWISTFILLFVLVMGSGIAVVAQEPGIDASATPTSEIDNSVSIGGETVSQIGTEAPTSLPETESPATESDSPEDGTLTPTPDTGGGIGDEESPGVSTGDASPVPDITATEETTPEPTATPDEPVTAASVAMSVAVYLCTADYGGGDPSADANCSPAPGIEVGVTADGASLGSITTNGAGTATVDAPDGSHVVFAETQSTLPSGYVPNGSGTASLTATDGASVTIVNIQVQTAGRLQIANGQCPTSGEARTQFIVVGPLAVQAAGLGCEPRGGTTLTVSGPGGVYAATTDANGNWTGTLPVGTYTVSNGSDSTELEVQSGATTIVLVVDYLPGPKGTLTIQRFDCSEGSEGTTITIDGAPNNSSCLPSNQRVDVSAAGGNAAPLAIDLGDDGTTTIDVAAGGYIVTDGPSGVSAAVQVDEGSSITATINSTILTGSVSASMYWCNSSASSSVVPGSWGNWTKKCGQAASGLQVSLLDGNGSVVSAATTGSNGSLSFSSLLPGRYSLSAAGSCALFANGADARNGFDIVAGGTVVVAAFACDASPAAPGEPSDPGPDSGSGGGGIGSDDGAGSGGVGSIGNDGGVYGGAPMANPDFHTRNLVANPLLGVSTLPSTGEGTDRLSREMTMLLLGLAMGTAALALGLAPARRKRAR